MEDINSVLWPDFPEGMLLYYFPKEVPILHNH